MQWLGVDIRGTLTEFVLYDQGGSSLRIEKVPGTPIDPSLAPQPASRAWKSTSATVARIVRGTTKPADLPV